MLDNDDTSGTSLTDAEAEGYRRDGFCSPLDVYTEEEAGELRAQLERIEKKIKDDPELVRAVQKRPTWLLPFADEIVRNPRITGRVASVLGPDVMVYNAAFFIKEANTGHFVSWHQDLHYWGFNADDEVTAWLALTPSTPESGCMRFVPGSHKRVVEHVDTFDENNMLTRGQELAIKVDDKDACDVVLRPGQMSMHHGRMCHGSGANTSADRRIGLAIRYITPAMHQVTGERFGATLVRGEDRYNHFELVPPPQGELHPDDLERWRRLMALDHAVKYRGAAQGPAYA
ncbi:MAG: phytanoyl-CoA dioxygenase family protein [Rhodospirillales bacterium]